MKMHVQAEKAPVLLIAYRKSDFLPEILSAIEKYDPPCLYLFSNHWNEASERHCVEKVRSILTSREWCSNVRLVFRDSHFLINDSIHAAIDHAFLEEERLIILEDDVIPSESFFGFCNEMLSRYEGCNEVGSIIGCNLGAFHVTASHVVAPFGVFYWGWATWKSAWGLNEETYLPWRSRNNGVTHKLSGAKRFFSEYISRLDSRLTWDLRWGWVQALHGKGIVLPGVNLVSNSGFVPEGSYIRHTTSDYKNLLRHDTDFLNSKKIEGGDYTRFYEESTARLISEILINNGQYDRFFPTGIVTDV